MGTYNAVEYTQQSSRDLPRRTRNDTTRPSVSRNQLYDSYGPTISSTPATPFTPRKDNDPHLIDDVVQSLQGVTVPHARLAERQQ